MKKALSSVTSVSELYTNYPNGGEVGFFAYVSEENNFYTWIGDEWVPVTYTTITEDTYNTGEYYFEGTINGYSGHFHLINYLDYTKTPILVVHHILTSQVFYRDEDLNLSQPEIIVLNEVERGQNEEVRKANELLRVEAEGLRATTFEGNESERQSTFENNEGTRENNELSRIEAEGGRVTAEGLRVLDEEQRAEDTATAISDAEDATVAANAAAEAAPHTYSLLSIITEPTGTIAEGAKYYNAANKLLHTLYDSGQGDLQWDAGVTPREQDVHLCGTGRYEWLNGTLTLTNRSITGNSRTAGDGSAGTVDTYRTTYSDGTYFDYYVRNGNKGTSASYSLTGYISVVAGQHVICNKSANGGAYNVWFDTSKVKTGTPFNTSAATAPADGYVRFTLNVTSAADLLAAKAQVEIGTSSSSWEIYKKTVSEEDITPLIARAADVDNNYLKISIAQSDYASLSVRKNLFNHLDPEIERGYYFTNIGDKVVSSAMSLTGYIPVVNGQIIYCNRMSDNAGYSNIFYNSSKQFVSSFATKYATAPANGYVRFTLNVAASADLLAAKVQVEIGVTSASTYEVYEKTLTESLIPSTVAKKTDIPDVSLTAQKRLDNLFYLSDPDYLANKWGVTSDLAGYITTGYISVVEGDVISVCHSGSLSASNPRLVILFNSNKVELSRSEDSNRTSYTVTGSTTKYIRLSNSWLSVVGSLQIEKSSSPTYLKKHNALNEDDTQTKYVGLDVILPNKIYLLNQKTDLFFKGFTNKFYKKDKRIRFTAITNATIDRQYENLITITPSATGVATVKVYDDEFREHKRLTLNTIVSSTTKTGNKNVLTIGDSFLWDSYYLEKAKTTCASGLNFIGIRHSSAIGAYHEGRGGWALDTYFQINTYQYSPHNPMLHPAIGRYWGSTLFWSLVMNRTEFYTGDGFSVYYNLNGFKTKGTEAGIQSNGYPANPLTDDIVYDNSASSYKKWDGSAWINTTTPANLGIDFSKYCSMWNIAVPDVIVVELGMNDFRFSPYMSYTAWNNNIASVLAALKLVNPTGVLGILVPITTIGSDLQDNSSEWPAKSNIALWRARKNIIETFDQRESEGYYVIDAASFFDEDYGFAINTWDTTTFMKPNQQYSGAETFRVQNGIPHPSVSGYNLIGISLAGFLQYIR